MIDEKHYVPILKGKEGEYNALLTIAAEVKAGLTPLIEVTPVPYVYPESGGKTRKMVDVHVRSVVVNLKASWGNERLVYLDLRSNPGSEPVADGRTAVGYALDECRREGIRVIPVTGPDRDGAYQESVRAAMKADGRGVCLRLEIVEPGEVGNLEPILTALLNTIEATPEDTDLLIDFRAVVPGQSGTITPTAEGLLGRLPFIRSWRSLILAATAFPYDLRAYKRDTTSNRERTEWLVWQSLQQRRAGLLRLPTFADYAVAHPEPFEDMNPRLIQMSANIRYTLASRWLIIKGKSIKIHKFKQMHQMCADLVARPEFYGSGFSWGDTYIAECAKRTDKPGNASTWRQVGTTHHLTVATKQIASLPWP